MDPFLDWTGNTKMLSILEKAKETICDFFKMNCEDVTIITYSIQYQNKMTQ